MSDKKVVKIELPNTEMNHYAINLFNDDIPTSHRLSSNVTIVRDGNVIEIDNMTNYGDECHNIIKLTRIDDNRFSGSLTFIEDGKIYDEHEYHSLFIDNHVINIVHDVCDSFGVIDLNGPIRD